MIKNIIIVVVFLLAIFLLNRFYKQSSMSYKENQVTLKTKHGTASIKYNLSKSNLLNFSNITIKQIHLADSKNSTFYEEASIEGLYEFSRTKEHIVKTLFEAKKVTTLLSLNELIAMQVTLKNNQIVNLFISDNSNKEFQLFYGLSTLDFHSILDKIKGEEISITLNKTLAIPADKPLTQWSVQHNDIDGIVSSIDY